MTIVRMWVGTLLLICCYAEISEAKSLRQNLFVVNSQNRHSLHKRQTDAAHWSSPEIASIRVDSEIQFRYSRTVIKTLMKNAGGEASELQFRAFVPESAFISNFSMIINGTEYVAEVKEKETAKKIYDDAVNHGQGAGLVEQDVRNANVFTVSANVEPEEKVEFILTYDELLQRNLGKYEHIIKVSPGQVVKNFEVVVNIQESLPLTKLEQEVRTSNDIDDEGRDTSLGIIERNVDGAEENARVSFKLDKKRQAEAGDNGFFGEFVVTYDVNRKSQSNEVQVIDGYFVHFFAPEELKVLPKHVIFVLDISGSMAGEKMTQLKDAMFTILSDMTENDFYNIILFSSDVRRWSGGQTDPSVYQPLKGTKANRDAGIEFIVGLSDMGATNINGALEDAIKLAEETSASHLLPENVQTMIVFLTDGQPTVGVVNSEEIQENARAANAAQQVPIFGIAFGMDADFDLMKKIAGDTDSFAKQIYEGSDAALQLEDFFEEISSPLITGLKFNYVGAAVDNDTLTNRELATFYKGGEYMIAGRLDETIEASDDPIDVEIVGIGSDDSFKENFSICLRLYTPAGNGISPSFPCIPRPSPRPRSSAQNFLKNLYAFLNIKQLIKKDTLESIERAKTLALENNFVTRLTSLVVRKPDNTGEIPALEPPRTAYNAFGIMHMPPSNFRSATSSSRKSYMTYSSAPAPGVPGLIANSGAGGIVPTSWGPFPSYRGASYSNSVVHSLPYPAAGPPGRPSFNYRHGTTTTRAPSTTTTNTHFISGDSLPPPDYDYDLGFDYFDGLDSSMTQHEAETVSEEPIKAPCQGNITLYSKTYYRGSSATFADDHPDMHDQIEGGSVSAKIEGTCCWQLFGDRDYDTNRIKSIRLIANQEYKSVISLAHLRGAVKSLKKVECDLFHL